jgi:3-oxoacyl-[acyl-carrier protein] reductase
MFSLAGKKALITGASGGIGETIAKRLADAGAAVALSGTRKEKLDEVNGALGGKASVLTCNLSDKEAVKKLAGDAEAALGGLDIIINNAGITKDGLAMRMSDEDWQQVLDVNLTASFILIRSALRGMMKQRFGRVVNVTSIVGVMGNAGQANYCASKAGIIGMSKSLAAEVASRNITINCVAPGFISTPMTDALNDAQKQAMKDCIPMGAFGEAADVAAAVHFLASGEAKYVTGQTLHVNGGMLMV